MGNWSGHLQMQTNLIRINTWLRQWKKNIYSTNDEVSCYLDIVWVALNLLSAEQHRNHGTRHQ